MAVLINLITLILFLGFFVLMGWIWWRIFKKAGYKGALGLLCLIPIANIIMLAILAFKEWPITKAQSIEARPSSLPAPLIAVIVVVALLPIIAMLAAIAIPNLLKARLTANESAAESSLKTITSAIENYAASHQGRYPSNEYDLVYATPAYLPRPFNNKTLLGYTYSLKLDSNGYQVSASPAECGVTGIKVFTAETGVKITDKNCK